ncbi:hypothetical protein [Saccharothrix texasensis]|uniref:hypothetical protein n=1 Tax=Saccharothrix texasensis TaxID=103734 RepID=UPI000F4D081B|nr:hypothetical protein [Saccharothrix texasensis]
MKRGDRERVLAVLRASSVPDRYFDFFRTCAPETLSEETLLSLGRYLQHTRQRDVRVRTVSIPSESEVGRALVAGWERDGGTTSGLTRFIAVVEHTFHAVNRGPGPTNEELERFWVAGGHDLNELKTLLPKVDRVVTDYLPT